jgi:hypothetical protein
MSIPPRLWPRTKIFFDGQSGGQLRVGDELGPIDERALIVAEDGDAPGRQPPSDVPERLVRADRFVTVIGAGTMNKDDRRKRPLPFGQTQGSGKAPTLYSDRHIYFLEFRSVGVLRRLVFGGWKRRHELEASDFIVFVEDNAGIECYFFEFAGDIDDFIAGKLIAARSRLPLENAELFRRLLPELFELVRPENFQHGLVEIPGRGREIAALEGRQHGPCLGDQLVFRCPLGFLGKQPRKKQRRCQNRPCRLLSHLALLSDRLINIQ